MNNYYKSKFDEMFDDIFCTGISVTPIFFETNTSKDKYLVDTSRYEVTEKPEWRKKMLEQEIESIETKTSHYQGQIEHLLSIQSELKENKKELQKQLKELDTKAE